MPDFLPGRESELVTWANNFNVKFGASPTTYGGSSAQATALAALFTAFNDAYQTANAPATRTPSAVIAKDDAMIAMVANIRELAGIIQKFPGTTDEMRSDLGLNVPAARTPIPPPAFAPVAEIVYRMGTMVRYRLHDGTGSRRGKPVGVQGARCYSHIGPTAPVDINDWTLEGQATKNLVDIEFGAQTLPGTVVWFTAQWYNAKGVTGIGCAALSANIAGGAMEQAA